MLPRRAMIAATAAGAALAGSGVAAQDATGLRSLTAGLQPISRDERLARIAKAQGLMQAQGIAAIVIEPGASLEYFTGVRWWLSERLTCAVIPARGEVVMVTPHFEEPSVRESLGVPGDVRPWHEHESPFARVVQALADRGATSGKVGIEAGVRFFVTNAIREASGGRYELVSADPVTRPCRMIKSPAELALMQAASDITLNAIRWTHGRVRAGMTSADIDGLVGEATRAQGGGYGGGLVLLNEASAYPHGSDQPQVVREGSVVLIDVGCKVHGYASDISRTFVFGQPTARQRKVWETVKRGQEIALQTARVGTPVHAVDDAVRAYYEREGWGPAYRLPGLSHRTGHGIGMEGHEPPNFVGNDKTLLAPGMCFSDEPGLYIPGAFGIRMEDCLYMTAGGPKLFSPLAKSIDDPI